MPHHSEASDTRTLHVDVHGAGRERLVLSPRGDLDMDTLPPLDAALREALATAPRELVVDLGEVGFLDSAGLNLLLRALQDARGRGTEFHLAAVPQQTARVLDLTGTDRVFSILPDSPVPSSPSPAD